MGLNLNNEDKQLPQNSQFEISLLGTGAGYGESVVIHLGYNNWIVVDSCINPKTKECLPLEYLRSRDVNVAKDVKLILCTHWHDDHIQGISELLANCDEAVFSMSACSDQKKFLQFVGLDYSKREKQPSTSSTEEIQACFNILEERNKPIKKACQDRLLLQLKNGNFTTNIYSLSPSDYMIEAFDREIAELFDQNNPDIRIPIEPQNHKSVAILIEVNGNCVLLGSDLEVSTNPEKGWICVLDKCQCLNKKSTLFKIPHHGSINGYHSRIWNELLSEDVTGILTPFHKGKKPLPEHQMIEKFLNHTEYLFITSDTGLSRSAKKRDHQVSKVINQFNNTVQELKFTFGIVKCTLNIQDENPKWEIKLIENAKRILKSQKN